MESALALRGKIVITTRMRRVMIAVGITTPHDNADGSTRPPSMPEGIAARVVVETVRQLVQGILLEHVMRELIS